MSDDTNDLSGQRFAWLRSGFDLEGYLGAFAAWLIGVLLSVIWGPLFWIGFIAAIIILFATRTAERTPPRHLDAVIAPVDGIVTSIGGAIPPEELRLEGDGWTRIRVSSSPTSSNGIYAPMDGAVDHIILETGDPSAVMAMKPDSAGLIVAYVSFKGGQRATGLRLATGGLGPRLELSAEAGDAVRLGRNIGTLRLGGWCDIYLPSDLDLVAWPGQKLVGCETVLAELDGKDTRRSRSSGPVLSEIAPNSAVDLEPSEEVVEAVTQSDASADEDPDEALTLEKIAGSPADVPEPDNLDAASDGDEEDVKAMFDRLRSEARKAYNSDD